VNLHNFLTGLGAGATLVLAVVIVVGARQVRHEARARREAAEREAAEEAARKARTERALHTTWGSPPHLYARPLGGGKWVDLGEVKVPVAAEPAQLQYGSIQLNRETVDALSAEAFCAAIENEWERE
jgi:hypothetical protein